MMSTYTLDVEKEYTKTFRTKSFLDIWALTHRNPNPNPSPPSLPDLLLQPPQDSLLHAATSSGGGAAAAFLDYLDATLQSFAAYTAVLGAIDRARSLHHAVQQLLPSAGAAPSSGDLAEYIDLGNPLSSRNLAPFHFTHALFPPLVARLTAERRRLRRRARAVRVVAMAAISLVGAAAVSTVVIATHAVAAVVTAAAAPALASCGGRRWRRWMSVGWIERAERRADVAAKGAFIVGRDMDTVSRMLRRMHDEMEHRRDVVRMVLGSGEGVVVKEAVRELQICEAGFQEQIEELEEHVYLCLLTINRSRRLLAEAMTGDASHRCRFGD